METATHALAGWSVLEEVSGFRYSAIDDSLRFAHARAGGRFQVPFVAGTGWGTYQQIGRDGWSRAVLLCAYREVRIRKLMLPVAAGTSIPALSGDQRVFPQVTQ